mmetsp:Transcript_58047/g.138135  ORF Transcript_58047/g.138135 Transcript_58047/m.138135 type:complete len:128 (+) Transcript_58047:74-457(+)
MAVRSRSRAFAATLLLAAACLAAHSILASPVFVQPRAESQVDPAAVAAAVAGLGVAVAPEAAQAATGPLTGTAACAKPLAYLIYPLCDPIFLISPLYMGPILVVFWGTVVTVINLLIPATQPDEDLR